MLDGGATDYVCLMEELQIYELKDWNLKFWKRYGAEKGINQYLLPFFCVLLLRCVSKIANRRGGRWWYRCCGGGGGGGGGGTISPSFKTVPVKVLTGNQLNL